MALYPSAISHCDPTTPAQILVPSISLFKQCAGIARPETLIAQFRASDFADAGVTETMDQVWLEEKTAAGPTARDYTRQAYDIKFSLNLQRQSSTAIIAALICGDDLTDDTDPDNVGGKVQEFDDLVGKQIRKYIMYFEVKSGGNIIHYSWLPNVAIKSGAIGAYNSGTNHTLALDCIALPSNLDDRGHRMTRHFTKFAV
jgi:hypothetical protein